MRRPEFLPIVAAMLLLAAACNRLDAQDGTSFYPTAGNAAQSSSPTRVRTGVQPAERTVAQPAEPLADPHHKSWKELARSKADGKSDKQVLTFSPWSAFGALAVVVGLILVLARVFRRHAPIFSQSLPQEALEILGRRHVDPKQTILLVRIGARILVVGSSASGLNPLGQIDDPVEVDLLAGLCRRGSQAGAWSTSFFRLLKGETKTRPGSSSARTVPQSTHPSARPAADFRAAMQRPGAETEDLSQPEHDLIRRLRGTNASLHADATEGVP
jgi:flagellar biogenesis protein FliO